MREANRRGYRHAVARYPHARRKRRLAAPAAPRAPRRVRLGRRCGSVLAQSLTGFTSRGEASACAVAGANAGQAADLVRFCEADLQVRFWPRRTLGKGGGFALVPRPALNLIALGGVVQQLAMYRHRSSITRVLPTVSTVLLWAAATASGSSASGVLAPPPAPSAVSFPPGPKLACKWDAGSSSLGVSWQTAVAPEPLAYPADVYEIQISASPFARASAIYTVSGLEAQLGLDLLLPNTTYFLSMRAHAGWAFVSGHFMGGNTWGKLGPVTRCTTGAASATARGRSIGGSGSSSASASAAETHTFESWRMSEYAAGEVDYLLNHDGADAAGSSLLFTALAQYEYRMGDLALQGSWMGGSTAVRKTPLLNDHFTNTGSGQP